MARLYANENFPWQVVAGLRASGHDVLTTVEAVEPGVVRLLGPRP
jgi:hypothetical protein